jgi:hypothetical protein
MNKPQRQVLKIFAAVSVAMLLFPPFSSHLPNGAQSNEGFSFLLFPPRGHWSIIPKVNTLQLIAQWIVLCMIGGICYVLTDNKPTAEHLTGAQFRQALKLAGPIAVPIMRLFRGLVLVLFYFIVLVNIVGIFQLTQLPAQENVDWGKALALLLGKIAGTLVIFLVMAGMRSLINWLYKAQTSSTDLLLPTWKSI